MSAGGQGHNDIRQAGSCLDPALLAQAAEPRGVLVKAAAKRKRPQSELLTYPLRPPWSVPVYPEDLTILIVFPEYITNSGRLRCGLHGGPDAGTWIAVNS